MKNEILVVIDMQNDFIDGSLGTKEAINIVDNVCNLIESEYKAVFLTMDTHYENYLNTLEGKKLPIKHCIKDTEGWRINNKIMTSLTKCSTNMIYQIRKETFGSERLVKEIEKIISDDDEIIICGLCTDICVVSNALLLREKFPNTIIKVIKNCCAGVTPETHEAALKTMQMCQIDIM